MMDRDGCRMQPQAQATLEPCIRTFSTRFGQGKAWKNKLLYDNQVGFNGFKMVVSFQYFSNKIILGMNIG